MPDMDSAELYEKGSFGRGCEPYAVPFFNTEQFSSKQSPQGTDEGMHVRNIDWLENKIFFNIIIKYINI